MKTKIQDKAEAQRKLDQLKLDEELAKRIELEMRQRDAYEKEQT